MQSILLRIRPAIAVLVCLAACALAAGCGQQPKVRSAAPAIRSIAIIPATEPPSYSVANVSALQFLMPLTGLVHRADSWEKERVFNQRMQPSGPFLAASFTEAVAGQLRGKGYDVRVLAAVQRPPGDPDNVDYTQIKTDADAVLHLMFKEVGLRSPRTALSYLPRVNARGTLFLAARPGDDPLYDEDIFYGVDARDGKAWAIAADPAAAYRDFDTVLAGLPAVRKAFEAGTQAIADRMALQIQAALR